MGGILSLLKSRKFWLMIMGGGVTLGIVPAEHAETAGVIILVLVGILMGTIAAEDVAKNIAEGIKKSVPPDDTS